MTLASAFAKSLVFSVDDSAVNQSRFQRLPFIGALSHAGDDTAPMALHADANCDARAVHQFELGDWAFGRK